MFIKLHGVSSTEECVENNTSVGVVFTVRLRLSDFYVEIYFFILLKNFVYENLELDS